MSLFIHFSSLLEAPGSELTELSVPGFDKEEDCVD